MAALLDSTRSIAPPGYDRLRAALATLPIQLALGQALALKVVTLPLRRVIGVSGPAPDDWSPALVAEMVPVALAAFGVAVFGFSGWVGSAGPRKAAFAGATCFGGGFLVAAVGASLHELAVVYAGIAAVGIGSGLAAVVPATVLLRWFPDRTGMASGLAVAGIGLGAVAGRPLAAALLTGFASPTSTGVVEALAVFGIVSFAVMAAGAFAVRLPGTGWAPPTYIASRRVTGEFAPVAPPVGTPAGRSYAQRRPVAPDVAPGEAFRTQQFWLLWTVIAATVLAATLLFGAPSAMIQALFPDGVNAAGALQFVILLGTAGGVGSLAWSALADAIGPKAATAACIALGGLFTIVLPTAVPAGSVAQFIVGGVGIAATCGGALAMLPAHVRDLFGPANVGAIYGRLLSALAAAALVGPELFDVLRASQQARGISTAGSYVLTVYVAAGLLAIAFAASLFVRPLPASRRN